MGRGVGGLDPVTADDFRARLRRHRATASSLRMARSVLASDSAVGYPQRLIGEDHLMVDQRAVRDWVAAYESAWRSPGTDALTRLFTESVTYVMSPWAEPIKGLDALRRFWDASRSPDERFEMRSEIVAIDGRVAIVRVAVDYGDGQRWRDLWVLVLSTEGRCEHFEEWPFASNQPDGHEGDR